MQSSASSEGKYSGSHTLENTVDTPKEPNAGNRVLTPYNDDSDTEASKECSELLKVHCSDMECLKQTEGSDTSPPIGCKVFMNTNLVIFSLLVYAGVFISYADRSNISIAMIPMKNDLHLTDMEDNAITSMFFLGYIPSQILGGILAHKFGGKTVFGVSILLTSVCTIIMPPLAMLNPWIAVADRIALGGFEGLSFPAFHAVIPDVVPLPLRAFIVAFITSASYIGNGFSNIISPMIVTKQSWQWVFYWFALAGIVWCVPWGLYHVWSAATERFQRRRRVEKYGTVAVTENDVARSNENAGHKIPWKNIMTSKEVWAIMINQYGGSFAFYIIIMYLPRYYKDVYGTSIETSGNLAAVPYFFSAFTAAIAGAISDGLMKLGLGIRAARITMQGIGTVGPAIFMLIIVLVAREPWEVSLCMTIAQGLAAFTCASVSVNQLDIAPKYAGVVFAAGNCAATVAGLVGNLLTGAILSWTHSWTLVFSMCILHYTVSFMIWILWMGVEEVII